MRRLGIAAVCLAACSSQPPVAEEERSVRSIELANSVAPFLRNEADSVPAVEVTWLSGAAFRLRDPKSGLSLTTTPIGNRDVVVRNVGRLRVALDALGDGISVAQSQRKDGIEDFVRFDAQPEVAELRYRIELGDGVQGLRQVEGVLELLDAGGAPRLRAVAPFAIDRSGARVPLTRSVVGCEVDESPAPPWNRAATPPGSRSCELRIGWSAVGSAYPLLVDPKWTLTANMSEGREGLSMTKLPNGRVLVAGGAQIGVPSMLTSCDLYDEQSGTFAVTGSLGNARFGHVSGYLSSSKVIVAGSGSTVIETTAELYDPVTGLWSFTDPLYSSCAAATGTVLADGSFLVVSGTIQAQAIDLVQRYDPGTELWTLAAPIPQALEAHAAVLLPDGKVLVAGGVPTGSSGPIDSALLFDPTSNAWTPTGKLNQAVFRHTLTLLSSGEVLVIGGLTDTLQPTAAVSSYVGNQFQNAGSLLLPRAVHVAARLGNDQVVVVGGLAGTTSTSTEVFTLGSGASPGGDLNHVYVNGAAVTLDGGAVLFCGGLIAEGNGVSNECRLFLAPNGLSCGGNQFCESGFCVDGMCCDTTCTGSCESCLAAAKGSGVDGECGFLPGGAESTRCVTQPESSCGLDGHCTDQHQCRLWAPATECVPGSCTDGAYKNSTCDGLGVCEPTATSCEPYVCAGGQCGASCASDDDCISSTFCLLPAGTCEQKTKGTCDGDHTVTLANGEIRDCAPFGCTTDGACEVQCGSSADCASGAICNVSHACVPKKPVEEADGGCGCRISETRTRSAWPALLAAVALGLRIGSRPRASARPRRIARERAPG